MSIRSLLARVAVAFPAVLAIAGASSVFAAGGLPELQAFSAELQMLMDQDARERLFEAHDVKQAGKELFADPTLSASETRDRDLQLLEPFVSFIAEDGRKVVLKDVPSNVWFGPYVRYNVERKIVTGYRDARGNYTGEFGPAREVSVEELAKMAIKAASVDEAGCRGEVRNPLAAQSWSLPYVRCAEVRSWAMFADGTVDLKRPATRAEVIQTIVQALNVPLIPQVGSGSVFADVGPSTQYAAAILSAQAAGIVSGYVDDAGASPSFRPIASINRAEVTKILSIAVQLFGK